MSGDAGARITIGLLAALLAMTPRAARAQTIEPFATSCSAELTAAVVSALEVELSSVSPEARAALVRGRARWQLACDRGDVSAVVAFGADRHEQRVDRDAEAQPRRLAIAIAELVEAEIVPDVAPPPPHVEPPPPPTETPALEERLRVRARLAGGGWIGGVPVIGLGAVEAGVELAPITNVAFVASIGGAFGSITTTDARLGVSLLSASASARFGGALGSFWLGGGPAIRGGAVFWSGTPRDPTDASGGNATGAWLGLGVVLAAFAHLPSVPLRLGLEVEGGGIAVHSGAIVFDRLVQQIQDWWLEPRLVVDVTFD